MTMVLNTTIVFAIICALSKTVFGKINKENIESCPADKVENLKPYSLFKDGISDPNVEIECIVSPLYNDAFTADKFKKFKEGYVNMMNSTLGDNKISNPKEVEGTLSYSCSNKDKLLSTFGLKVYPLKIEDKGAMLSLPLDSSGRFINFKESELQKVDFVDVYYGYPTEKKPNSLQSQEVELVFSSDDMKRIDLKESNVQKKKVVKDGESEAEIKCTEIDITPDDIHRPSKTILDEFKKGLSNQSATHVLDLVVGATCEGEKVNGNIKLIQHTSIFKESTGNLTAFKYTQSYINGQRTIIEDAEKLMFSYKARTTSNDVDLMNLSNKNEPLAVPEDIFNSTPSSVVEVECHTALVKDELPEEFVNDIQNRLNFNPSSVPYKIYRYNCINQEKLKNTLTILKAVAELQVDKKSMQLIYLLMYKLDDKNEFKSRIIANNLSSIKFKYGPFVMGYPPLELEAKKEVTIDSKYERKPNLSIKDFIDESLKGNTQEIDKPKSSDVKKSVDSNGQQTGKQEDSKKKEDKSKETVEPNKQQAVKPERTVKEKEPEKPKAEESEEPEESNDQQPTEPNDTETQRSAETDKEEGSNYNERRSDNKNNLYGTANDYVSKYISRGKSLVQPARELQVVAHRTHLKMADISEDLKANFLPILKQYFNGDSVDNSLDLYWDVILYGIFVVGGLIYLFYVHK